MGFLETTIAAVMKVTTKVAICLYINKMVLTAKMTEYKLEVTHSALNTITLTSTIGLAVKPSQNKVASQSMEL